MFIACEILDIKCEWSEALFTARSIFPEMSVEPSILGVRAFNNIWHSGTHTAYVNLINKDTDFIIVARMPSDDEILQAGVKRVELDVRPIAPDAFVFVAHVDNPVNSLTLEQIREIYTGKITEWRDLGGEGTINAYQRNPNSGSQKLMEDLVMEGNQMMDAPDMTLESIVGPINAIQDDRQ